MSDQIQDCKCNKKCFSLIPHDVIRKIYEGYNLLPNNDVKNLYLYGLMCKTSDKSGEPNSRASYRYFLKVNGFQVDVCLKAFVNIHGIKFAKVRNLTQKLDEGVIYPCDRRGKNLKRVITNETIEQEIVAHIKDVFRNEEALTHLKRGEKVNIAKMWENYKLSFIENLSTDVTQDFANDSIPRTPICQQKYAQIFKKVFSTICSELGCSASIGKNSSKKARI